MTDDMSMPSLSAALRAERRRRHLSLRDLADEIGVSFNTLSRVERGFLPDLKNYDRIASWLGAPTTSLLRNKDIPRETTAIISKHLFADARLDSDAAEQIAKLVQEMYDELAAPTPAFSVHLRSAQTFLPSVGPLLADALEEMQNSLLEELR